MAAHVPSLRNSSTAILIRFSRLFTSKTEEEMGGQIVADFCKWRYIFIFVLRKLAYLPEIGRGPTTSVALRSAI